MTWTYTPDFDTARDQIRIRIGDTDSSDEQLQDEEINYAYTQAGSSVVGGAILCCEWLAGKYARLVDAAVGDLRQSYTQASEHYRALAKTLTKKLAIGDCPVAGGVSIARVQAVEEDTDRVEPAFKVGMMDDPDVVESWQDEEKWSTS